MLKNSASQSLTLYCVDASTGLPKTGDSANQVFYVSKDDGAVTAIASNSGVPTEIDATNAKGLYKIALSQAETNADKLLFSGKSSTSNIVVVPTVVYTDPPLFTGLSVDASGRIDVGKALGTAVTLDSNNVLNVSAKYFAGQVITCAAGVTVLASVGTAATSTAQTGDAFARLGAPAGASAAADVAAVKSDTASVVAKLPANAIADETLVITATNAILARLGTPAGASVSADIAALFTTALTESYNADGSPPTPAQALMLILQRLTEFAISGTTVTVKKLNGSTTAATLTLDSSTAPTSSTRTA